MSCRICGEHGHNSKTCPNKNQQVSDVRDTAMWIKFDNMTRNESTDLLHAIVKDKDRIAPDVRATFARDYKKNLPNEIRKALNLKEESDE